MTFAIKESVRSGIKLERKLGKALTLAHVSKKRG